MIVDYDDFVRNLHDQYFKPTLHTTTSSDNIQPKDALEALLGTDLSQTSTIKGGFELSTEKALSDDHELLNDFMQSAVSHHKNIVDKLVAMNDSNNQKTKPITDTETKLLRRLYNSYEKHNEKRTIKQKLQKYRTMYALEKIL